MAATSSSSSWANDFLWLETAPGVGESLAAEKLQTHRSSIPPSTRRPSVVRWVRRLCRKHECPQDVFAFAVYYFDRMTSTNRSLSIDRTRSIAVSCYALAMKFHWDWVSFRDVAGAREQWSVCEALEWRMNPVTLLPFVRFLLAHDKNAVLSRPRVVETLADCVTRVIANPTLFAAFRPSVQATACVYAAAAKNGVVVDASAIGQIVEVTELELKTFLDVARDEYDHLKRPVPRLRPPVHMETRDVVYEKLAWALGALCNAYEGSKSREIRSAVANGHVFEAYFTATQASQDFANETKKLLFLPVAKSVGKVATSAKTDDGDDDGDVAPRKRDWKTRLDSLMPWWRCFEGASLLRELISARAPLSRAVRQPREGTVRESWRFSDSPRDVGTYFHEAFGESMAYECARMFGPAYEQLEHIVPGRMLHCKIPFLAVTPDVISVRNETKFLRASEKLVFGDGKASRETAEAMPLMAMELKTIHGKSDVTLAEMRAVLDRAVDDQRKSAALDLFRDKLKDAAWMPRDVEADPALDKYELKRTRGGKCQFYRRGVITYPRKGFDALKVRRATCKVYPNFAKTPPLAVGRRRRRPVDDPLDECSVDVKRLVKPGKACMVLYDVSPDRENRVLCRFQWDEAPLMLSLNCDHFNQVMCQHLVASQYAEGVEAAPPKSVFAIALRADRADRGTPHRLAILYAYDTGVTAYAAERFAAVLTHDLASALDDAHDEPARNLFVDAPSVEEEEEEEKENVPPEAKKMRVA